MTDKEKTMLNLKKVLFELPLLAEKHPEIKADFDMNTFGIYSGLRINEIQYECKTYGCLLGNIARLFNVSNSEYYRPNGKFFDYMRFGYAEFPWLHGYTKDWSFLFDAYWVNYQPTFEQAMNRLGYYISKNGLIGEWDYQTEKFV